MQTSIGSACARPARRERSQRVSVVARDLHQQVHIRESFNYIAVLAQVLGKFFFVQVNFNANNKLSWKENLQVCIDQARYETTTTNAQLWYYILYTYMSK